MFAHSTTLTSLFPSFISKTDGFEFTLDHLSQKSMVLSQLQLACLYYLELSLTALENYRIYSLCESLINSFGVSKCEKTTTTK